MAEELTPNDLLVGRGWRYHVPSAAWYHIGKGLGDLGMHAALKEEGYAVRHRFAMDTGFCMDCGMHVRRMQLSGLPDQCEGIPDPQAFEDREAFAWFDKRIAEILEAGGEGWLFIMGVDLEDEDAS